MIGFLGMISMTIIPRPPAFRSMGLASTTSSDTLGFYIPVCGKYFAVTCHHVVAPDSILFSFLCSFLHHATGLTTKDPGELEAHQSLSHHPEPTSSRRKSVRP